MMEYPRRPFSELHLATFPDSMDFQSWEATFKTEVCAKRANPQVTMSCITEVEKAMGVFVQQELVNRFKDYQTFSLFRIQNDDVQDFDVRWDQALLSADEQLSVKILEGLYKSKLPDSVQLQTVLTLYDQETLNGEKTSYFMLKSSVRLQIDQKMRSRKPETKWFTEEKWHGVEKETKPKLKGLWEIAGIAKQQDDVLKETHVVFVMELTLVETRASIQNKNEHPLRHPNWRQHKMKRENRLIKRMKNQLTGKATFHVIGEIVPIPCVALSTLPFVKATFQKQDADVVKVVSTDMLSQMRHLTKSRRKTVRKDRSQCWRNWHRWIACLNLRRSLSGERRTEEPIPRLNSHVAPGTTWKYGNEKVCLMFGVLAPKFAERSQKDTLQKERCARKVACILAKMLCKLNNLDKATFYSPVEERGIPAATSLLPEDREFAVDSGARMHMLGKRDLSSDEKDTVRRSRPPTVVITANGEVQTFEEAQIYGHDLGLFVTVQLLNESPAVLSLGKLCDDHGYSYEWITGQQPQLNKNGNKITCKTDNFVPLVVPGLSSSSGSSSSSASKPHAERSWQASCGKPHAGNITQDGHGRPNARSS